MKEQEILIKEAERQRKLLAQHGLDRHLDQLRNSAVQAAIDAATRIPMRQFQELTDQMMLRNERAMAAMLKPYEEIQKTMANTVALQLADIGKKQLQFAVPNLERLNLKALYDSTAFNEKMNSLHSAGIDRLIQQMSQTKEINQIFEVAKRAMDFRHLEARAAMAASYDVKVNDYLAGSMRAAYEVRQFIQQNAFRMNFPVSFVADLFASFPYAAEEEVDELSTDEIQKRLIEFLKFLIETVRNLDPGWINAMAMVSLILALLVPVYQSSEGQKTQHEIQATVRDGDEQLRQEMRALEAQLILELERLKPSTIDPTLYVVERMASLKVAPRPKSITMATLPPNQLVALKERKGRWIQVEYFDYIDGTSKIGWVLKKYLKRVPSD